MIFVLSDTHVPDRIARLPQKFLEKIKSGDVVFHAGDFVQWTVLEDLQRLATVHGVCGNMDETKIQRLLPEKKLVEVQGKKVGLCHGSGPSHELWKRVCRNFEDKCDVLIFGHSHSPFNQKIGDTLFFNPGSLSSNLVSPFNATYGTISIEGDEVWAEIFQLK
jgi:putative phosphoesterase